MEHSFFWTTKILILNHYQWTVIAENRFAGLVSVLCHLLCSDRARVAEGFRVEMSPGRRSRRNQSQVYSFLFSLHLFLVPSFFLSAANDATRPHTVSSRVWTCHYRVPANDKRNRRQAFLLFLFFCFHLELVRSRQLGHTTRFILFLPPRASRFLHEPRLRVLLDTPAVRSDRRTPLILRGPRSQPLLRNAIEWKRWIKVPRCFLWPFFFLSTAKSTMLLRPGIAFFAEATNDSSIYRAVSFETRAIIN